MMGSFDGNLTLDQIVPNLPSPTAAAQLSPGLLGQQRMEHFSRKVFVGGLPPDIDEGKIHTISTRLKIMVLLNLV